MTSSLPIERFEQAFGDNAGIAQRETEALSSGRIAIDGRIID
jgi:hypothetical protein